MTLTAEQQERLDLVTALHSGKGSNGLEDACVMQAVDWVYRNKDHFTDTPECTPPSLRRFAIVLNDARWPSDEARTEILRPLIPLLVGADASAAAERKRFFLFADFAVREAAPMAFDALYARTKKEIYREQAAKMRAVAQIVDADTARAANKVAAAADAAASAYAASAYAADAAASAYAAASAASAYAANAAAYAAADAAAYAADAAASAYAADAAASAYAANAAAYAADADAAAYAADADAANAAAAAARLPILKRAAEVLAQACEVSA